MYTYGELNDDVNYLNRYGFETGDIGTSTYGRAIPYVRLRGRSGDRVIITAGIHAREHVSSLFAVKQLYKMSVSRLPCDFYFVPIVNPDGNQLVNCGAQALGDDASKAIALNGGSDDFSLWKANGAGVDLNVNFDARWGEGKLNSRIAGAENYIGASPFSEPESRALAAFTRKLKPCLTLSYHAKGREIYYDFAQTGERLARDRAIAEYAAALTGFTLVDGDRGSAGGYKDWCVSALGIPSLTLELAPDECSHPLSDADIREDFEREPVLPIKLYDFMKEHGYV